MKWREALGVGADAIAVGTFGVGLAIVAVSYASDKLALGLGVALAISLVANIVLFVRLRRRSAEPVWYEAQTAVIQTFKHTPEERATAQQVLDHMNEAMDKFEYDNAHGLDSAGDEARTAARKAKTTAEGISDLEIRNTVGLFEEAIIHSPRGWREQGGANLTQMDRVRDVHTIAVKIVGAMLRPEGR